MYSSTLFGRHWQEALTLSTLFFCCFMQVDNAFSMDEIYSPNAEYRELSLEFNGARTFDSNPDKNNAQLGEVTFEASPFPRTTLEISGIYSNDADTNLQLVAHEIAGRYQFVESGEYWLDAGIKVAYDFSTLNNRSDSYETKLLLQKDSGMFTHTANFGFNQRVGAYSIESRSPEYVLLWNTRYRFNIYFQPGLELQSELGPSSQFNDFNAQPHYLGPAIYGKLFNHLKYQIAYFAGISNAASSRAARLMAEYETHF